MDSDLSDIQKIADILKENQKDNDSATPDLVRCDSADDDSMASSYQQHLTPQADRSFHIFEELNNSSDEDQLFIDDEPPSLEYALKLNIVYQQSLLDLLQALEVMKLRNQEKQKQAIEDLEELQSVEANIKSKKKKIKKIPFSFFGMPYFKNLDYNSPPKNEDTILAETIGFRNICLFNLCKPFSKVEIRRLRKGLKEQAITLEAKRLMNIRETLLARLKAESSCLSEAERKELDTEIETVQRQIYQVNSTPEEKMFDVSPTAFDWQKIAIINFQRSRTPDQLRLFWIHNLRPGVNCRPWTRAENDKLRDIVKEFYSGIPWEEVALRMGTNRTAFDCFRRYQERYNEQHRKFGWTKEENKKLIQLLGSYSDKPMGDIEWDGVRQHFPGKSKSQIYAHFRYYVSTCANNSSFTNNEDTVILEGVKMGFDLSDIALLLGNRSLVQIRQRYKAIQKKNQGNSKHWTENENNMLLAMRDSSELQRHLIKKKFPGRTFAQLFSRFHFLRMKSSTPEIYVKELKEKSRKNHKALLPRDNLSKSKQIMGMLKHFGDDKKKKAIMKKKIPLLRNHLLGVEEYISRLDPRARIGRPRRLNRTIVSKEKELKGILRPLMHIHTTRPRKLSFPGDGREHGIVLACLYRLLHCNFTLAPKGDLTEEQVEQLGIPPQHVSAFINLLSLTRDMLPPPSTISTSLDNFLYLPPTLNTLVGFRGLLLHRKYIQSSAWEGKPLEVTITEIPNEHSEGNDEEAEVMEVEQATESLPPNATESQIILHSNEGNSQPSDGPENQELNSSVTLVESTGCSNKENEKSLTEPDHRESNSSATSVDCGTTVDERVEEESEDANPNEKSMEEEVEIASMSSESTGQHMDQGSTNDSGSEYEEEDSPDSYFGNRRADDLLLSRLMALFFWPGVMSTTHAPDPAKTSNTASPVGKDPLALDAASPTPPQTPQQKTPKISKKELKEIRRKNIQLMVRRRFGQPEPTEETSEQTAANASTSAPTNEPTNEQDEPQATPPPTKKTRPYVRRKPLTPVPVSPVKRSLRKRQQTQ